MKNLINEFVYYLSGYLLKEILFPVDPNIIAP